jgi:hypothetical protein
MLVEGGIKHGKILNKILKIKKFISQGRGRNKMGKK